MNQFQIQISDHKNQIGPAWLRSPSLVQSARVQSLDKGC